MMNPANSLLPPKEIIDVFNDASDHEENSDGEFVEAIYEDVYFDVIDVENLDLHPGGEYVARDNVAVAGDRQAGADNAVSDTSSESEDDRDGAEMLQAIGQVESRETCHPVPDVRSPQPGGSRGVHPVASGGRRARRPVRPHRCGQRAGRIYVPDSSERRPIWTRGEPLLERYRSNEELPVPLREEIERVTANRDETTRARRNIEVEEDESDGENVFLNENESFVWTGMDGWNGVKETFLPENPGPTLAFNNTYDSFRSYWDDALLSHIVDETNRYAQGIQSEGFRHGWVETNIHEMLILFAFWMMLGIHKMPTIKSCFSNLPELRTEIFRSMFRERRYWDMNRAFHLSNGSQDANDPGNVLYPMGPVIDSLNSKFKAYYTLHQDICIDESLTLWKGPGGFKQYIKTKSARFGIKTYQLCESTTGYLWSFFVYVGRQTTTSILPSSVSTVVRLVQPLLNLGHVLYMDNWFNSPMLARYLKLRHMDCVGTLRPSRANVPAVIQRTPLVEGEFIARQSGDVMVVALQDRKWLTCISTFHDVTQVQKAAKPGRPSHFKLQLIEDYNRGMGGVDRLDQMLEPYLVERKQCSKWPKKLFKRLLNITIQNARILMEGSTNTKIPSLAFRLDLVRAIMTRHLKNVPTCNVRIPARPHLSYPQFPVERLTERHFLWRIPITDEMRATVKHACNLGRRHCVWCTACGRRGKKSAYECRQCKLPLCLEVCFEEFHTIP